MATIKGRNYAFRQPRFNDGDVVESGMYMQLDPNTLVGVGVKNVTVRGGNWVNCAVPKDWIIEGGNFAQISFWHRQHPEFVKGKLNPRDYTIGLDATLDANDTAHRVTATPEWQRCSEREYNRIKALDSRNVRRSIVDKATTGQAEIVFEKLDHRWADERVG